MQTDSLLSGLAHTIQLALAPVFLLSGVFAFLNVLTNRLGRIIDRQRFLDSPSALEDPTHEAELVVLWARTHLINRAITLCTYCALLVAVVVASIFIGAVAKVESAMPVTIGFLAAMIALIGGLISFLREVHLSVKRLRSVAPRRRR
jgi:hypothetical protein